MGRLNEVVQVRAWLVQHLAQSQRQMIQDLLLSLLLPQTPAWLSVSSYRAVLITGSG